MIAFVKFLKRVLLLRDLRSKSKPFVYVDTHAGRGAYNLSSEETSQPRSLAHFSRFHLLRQANNSLPDATQELLRIADRLGESIYPGSPVIAQALCRPNDSLALCEIATEEHRRLEALIAGDDRAKVLCVNGYKALLDRGVAMPSKRALVFCDPSYQLGSDNQQIEALVAYLAKHWRSARVAIWYPVTVDTSKMARLKEAVSGASRPFEVLSIEMVWSDGKGTGMLLVQPPYGIDVQLQEELLPPLAAILKPVKTRVQWLGSLWNLKQPLMFETPSEDVRLVEREKRVTKLEHSLAALLKAAVLDGSALTRLVADAASWLAPPKARLGQKYDLEIDDAAKFRRKLALQRRFRDVLIQSLNHLDLTDTETCGIVQPVLDYVRKFVEEYEVKHGRGSIVDARHGEQWRILQRYTIAVDRGSENVPTEPFESGDDASGGSRMAYIARKPHTEATVTESKALRRYQGNADGLPDAPGFYIIERIRRKDGAFAYQGFFPQYPHCAPFNKSNSMYRGYQTPDNQVGPNKTANQAWKEIGGCQWEYFNAADVANQDWLVRGSVQVNNKEDDFPNCKRRICDHVEVRPSQRLRTDGLVTAPLRIGNSVAHETHRICITRGLAWCVRCGGFGALAGQKKSRCVKLAKPCLPPTDSGTKYKRKLMNDQLPDSRMEQWPDGTTSSSPQLGARRRISRL